MIARQKCSQLSFFNFPLFFLTLPLIISQLLTDNLEERKKLLQDRKWGKKENLIEEIRLYI